MPRSSLTARDARAAVIAVVREIGPAWWLLALAVTTLTDLVDFLAVPPPGERPGAGFVGAMILRVVLLFWASYALLRRMAGVPVPLRPAAALGRYVLFTIALLLVFGVASKGVGEAAGLAAQPLATQWLALFLVTAAWGIATIRLVGLSAAYAGGVPFAGTRAVIASTRGHAVALAACFAQIVLPFAAIHLAFTLLAVRLPLADKAIAALALLDGVVSGIQLLLSLALSVAAYQIPGRIAGRRFP